MKHISGLVGFAILAAVLAIGSAFLPTVHIPESLSAQRWRLQQVLARDQKLFHLEQYATDLEVRHSGQFHSGEEVWGDLYEGQHGFIIEILALEDMPSYWTDEQRKAWQRDVVQHEVLHIVLSEQGVPEDFQDKLIYRLLPEIKKP